jgi:hypothetical protein
LAFTQNTDFASGVSFPILHLANLLALGSPGGGTFPNSFLLVHNLAAIEVMYARLHCLKFKVSFIALGSTTVLLTKIFVSVPSHQLTTPTTFPALPLHNNLCHLLCGIQLHITSLQTHGSLSHKEIFILFHLAIFQGNVFLQVSEDRNLFVTALGSATD